MLDSRPQVRESNRKLTIVKFTFGMTPMAPSTPSPATNVPPSSLTLTTSGLTACGPLSICGCLPPIETLTRISAAFNDAVALTYLQNGGAASNYPSAINCESLDLSAVPVLVQAGHIGFNLTGVSHLYLGSNRLTTVAVETPAFKADCQRATGLELLDLSDNWLAVAPTLEHAHLTALLLANNTMMTLIPRGAFAGLPNLKDLDLAGVTSLRHIGPGIFFQPENPRMERVRLSGSGVEAISPLAFNRTLDANNPLWKPFDLQDSPSTCNVRVAADLRLFPNCTCQHGYTAAAVANYTGFLAGCLETRTLSDCRAVFGGRGSQYEHADVYCDVWGSNGTTFCTACSDSKTLSGPQAGETTLCGATLCDENRTTDSLTQRSCTHTMTRVILPDQVDPSFSCQPATASPETVPDDPDQTTQGSGSGIIGVYIGVSMALVLAVIVPVVVVHRRRLSGSIKLRIAFAEVSTAFLNFTFLFVWGPFATVSLPYPTAHSP